jgi:uncharacterized membrane protein
MRRAVLVAVIALAILFGGAAAAWAQRTGGSAGGGSFSGGGARGGGSSSYGGGGGGRGWSGAAHGRSGSGLSDDPGGGTRGISGARRSAGWSGCEAGVLLTVVLVGGAILFAQSVAIRRRRRRDAESAPARGRSRRRAGARSRGNGKRPSGPREMHTSVLEVSIDRRGRDDLIGRMARVATSCDTASAAGRARLLRKAAAAVRDVERAWTHIACRDLGWTAADAAETAFDRASADMRARFDCELVRNADGLVTTRPAPTDGSARDGQDPGVLVVSFIVVARRAVSAVEDSHDRASIRAALDDLGALGESELVAVEVVWSPAADQDLMSVAEMEASYPELERIDPAAG